MADETGWQCQSMTFIIKHHSIACMRYICSPFFFLHSGSSSGVKRSSQTAGAQRAKKTKKGQESGGGSDSVCAIGSKDNSLFLFRALGKILYCKRESVLLISTLYWLCMRGQSGEVKIFLASLPSEKYISSKVSEGICLQRKTKTWAHHICFTLCIRHS